MKRYLLFAGDTYYPEGGWDDFINSFDTEAEAIKEAKEKINTDLDWCHIVDWESGRIIYNI